MRVSARGYFRDHGSMSLIEVDLSKLDVYPREFCPENQATIWNRTSELEDSSVSIITRVNVIMQGNYRFEIRLTLSDILSLFWIAFKDKALQVVFQSRAETPNPESASAA